MPITRIRTIYQADPVGTVPGGIDTFIRGLIKFAPDDLEFSLVGMTTDPGRRPPGRWTRCALGRREFDFFPAFVEHDAGRRSRVPLTLRLAWHAWRQRAQTLAGFDVLELHRIEPLLLLLDDVRPKNAFFHTDMTILYNCAADIRWRAVPRAYFWLEERLVPRLASAYCVRESGAAKLRERFPALAAHTHFVPTWVDTELFWPEAEGEMRQRARDELRAQLGLDPQAVVMASVGRIDRSKNPALLLDAFALAAARQPRLTLVYVGDGVLRPQIESRAADLGVASRVRFTGLMPQTRIAQALRGADLFALSSSYEGMPMALLEALGSGLPVVSTDVGEVRRVVGPGNGEIVADHEPVSFAAAMDRVLARLDVLRGMPCVAAIAAYTPDKILRAVYENYRRLGALARGR